MVACSSSKATTISCEPVPKAKLSGCKFIGADLTGAKLTKANFIGVYLIGADLWKANLTGANSDGAKLSGIYL